MREYGECRRTAGASDAEWAHRAVNHAALVVLSCNAAEADPEHDIATWFYRRAARVAHGHGLHVPECGGIVTGAILRYHMASYNVYMPPGPDPRPIRPLGPLRNPPLRPRAPKTGE